MEPDAGRRCFVAARCAAHRHAVMPSKTQKVTIVLRGAQLMAKQPGIDIDVVRTLARLLPDVAESTSPRGTGLKVRGRLLACEAIHTSAEPNSLMVTATTRRSGS
jgi:hypothetical protein